LAPGLTSVSASHAGMGMVGPQTISPMDNSAVIIRANHMSLLHMVEENALNGFENSHLKHEIEENLKKIDTSQKDVILELGRSILLLLLAKRDIEKVCKDYMDILWEHCYYCAEMPVHITHTVLEHPDEKIRYDANLQIQLMKRNLINIPAFDKIFAGTFSLLFSHSVVWEQQAAAFKCLVKVLKVNVYKEKWIPIQKFPLILKCFSTLQQKQTLAGWDKEIQKNVECILNTADGDDQYYGLYTFSSKNKQKTALHEDAIVYFGDIDMAFYESCFRWFEKLLVSSEKEEMDSFLAAFEREIYSYQRPGHTRRFFTYVAEICVASACNSHLVDLGGGKTFSHCNSLDYTFVDGFTKFIMVLVKTCRENKKEMLNQILYSILVVFYKDHELLKDSFNPRPYFRLFYNILYDIHREEYNFEEGDKVALLSVLVKTLEGIQPLLFQKFACAWLNLISLPQFLRNLTISNPSLYSKLLFSLLRFLRKLIDRDGFKTKYAQLFYTGVIRLFTVLLMDCSEYCSAEFFSLLQECPKQLHQLRSCILCSLSEERDLNIGEDRLVFDNFQVFFSLLSLNWDCFGVGSGKHSELLEQEKREVL
jgi:CCR4-Not complex component, Not1